jgi:hypothetical protein
VSLFSQQSSITRLTCQSPSMPFAVFETQLGSSTLFWSVDMSVIAHRRR